ncbi:hypothetical protein QBC35DRAFT_501188 [Podospora australis]|uniref:Uncharacterized protein n=1 Tax=Podospora australis TaxID=1536484 RepID=A0AAN7AHR6_9PEZI|nr:hypothetical protein QBC35DRAFT_501188 [Podospora australis]
MDNKQQQHQASTSICTSTETTSSFTSSTDDIISIYSTSEDSQDSPMGTLPAAYELRALRSPVVFKPIDWEGALCRHSDVVTHEQQQQQQQQQQHVECTYQQPPGTTYQSDQSGGDSDEGQISPLTLPPSAVSIEDRVLQLQYLPPFDPQCHDPASTAYHAPNGNDDDSISQVFQPQYPVDDLPPVEYRPASCDYYHPARSMNNAPATERSPRSSKTLGRSRSDSLRQLSPSRHESSSSVAITETIIIEEVQRACLVATKRYIAAYFAEKQARYREERKAEAERNRESRRRENEKLRRRQRKEFYRRRGQQGQHYKRERVLGDARRQSKRDKPPVLLSTWMQEELLRPGSEHSRHKMGGEGSLEMVAEEGSGQGSRYVPLASKGTEEEGEEAYLLPMTPSGKEMEESQDHAMNVDHSKEDVGVPLTAEDLGFEALDHTMDWCSCSAEGLGATILENAPKVCSIRWLRARWDLSRVGFAAEREAVKDMEVLLELCEVIGSGSGGERQDGKENMVNAVEAGLMLCDLLGDPDAREHVAEMEGEMMGVLYG